MTSTNPHVEKLTASTTEVDVDTDGSGDVVVSVTELRNIESPADASASASGGYVANVQSVDGHDVTVRVFESAGSAAELSAVTGTTDLTDVHVKAEGY